MNETKYVTENDRRIGFKVEIGDLFKFDEIIKNQLQKHDKEGFVVKKSYKIKHKNGAVHFLADIEEIKSEENFRDTEIKEISLAAIYVKETDKSFYISNTLENYEMIYPENINYDLVAIKIMVPQNNYYNISIKYFIVSSDYDWLLNTKSRIDDRISFIKRPVINIIQQRVLRSFLVLLALVVVPLSFFSRIESSVERNITTEYILQIENRLNNGEEVDLKRFIVELEKLKNEKPKIEYMEGIKIAIYPAILIVVLYALLYFTNKFYNPYLFYFGYKIEESDRNNKILKIIYVVIILGIILGVVVNYISTLLFG